MYIKINFSIYLVGIPQIQPFFFPDALSVGQQTSVSCTLNKGSQPVSFRWLKDGIELTNNNNIAILTIQNVVLLTINPVMQNSSGNYTCIVSNSVGKDEYTAPLLVKGKLYVFMYSINVYK